MSTGTTSSAAEQARLRRERREKKILGQGTSRLEKISRLQGGATAREVLQPDSHEPEASSQDGSTTSPTQIPRSPDTTEEASPAASPGRNVFSVDGGDEDPFNILGGWSSSFPGDLKDDPMMRLLLNNPMLSSSMQSLAAAGGIGGTSQDSGSDGLNQLTEKINKQLFGDRSAGEEVVILDSSAWKWKFARVVSIVTILTFLWTQLEDIHFSRHMDVAYGMPIFYTFIAVSLSLQAFRLVLDQGRPPPGSTIAKIGSFLPHPFGTVLISFARYRMILTDLLEDFSVLLLGLAVMFWFKTR